MRTILCLLAVAAAVLAGEELLFFSHEGAVWVAPDGKAKDPDPKLKWIRGGADLRTDAGAWFRARPQSGNGGVFMYTADGTGVRRLTKGTNPAVQATATRDGRTIAYAYRVDGLYQIHVAKIGAEPVTGRRITNAKTGCTLPRIAPDASLVAYLRESRGGRSKLRSGDVMLIDPATGKETRLLAGVQPLTSAFSPDGSKLAIGTSQALEVFDVKTRKRTHRITWASIDKRLYAHGPQRLAWNPKGDTVACKISFLGGRAAINGNFKPMFGDHELFFIPLAGKPRWVTLPDKVYWGPVRWR